jgi:hypothetical protein
MVKITGRRTDLASVPFSLAVTRDAALQTHGSLLRFRSKAQPKYICPNLVISLFLGLGENEPEKNGYAEGVAARLDSWKL